MGGCSQNASSMGRLRTSSTILKMTLQHTMLRLHLIAFFYSQLTPWYCFSKRVLRIISTAFFVYGGCVNFFFHSTILNDSLRSSSFHISCLRRLNFRHSIRPNSLRGMTATEPLTLNYFPTVWKWGEPNCRGVCIQVRHCTSRDDLRLWERTLVGVNQRVGRSFPRPDLNNKNSSPSSSSEQR